MEKHAQGLAKKWLKKWVTKTQERRKAKGVTPVRVTAEEKEHRLERLVANARTLVVFGEQQRQAAEQHRQEANDLQEQALEVFAERLREIVEDDEEEGVSRPRRVGADDFAEVIKLYGVDPEFAGDLWAVLLDLIQYALVEDYAVMLRRIGTLAPYDTKPTNFYNPATKKKELRPSRRYVRFSLSPVLKEAL